MTTFKHLGFCNRITLRWHENLFLISNFSSVQKWVNNAKHWMTTSIDYYISRPNVRHSLKHSAFNWLISICLLFHVYRWMFYSWHAFSVFLRECSVGVRSVQLCDCLKIDKWPNRKRTCLCFIHTMLSDIDKLVDVWLKKPNIQILVCFRWIVVFKSLFDLSEIFVQSLRVW